MNINRLTNEGDLAHPLSANKQEQAISLANHIGKVADQCLNQFGKVWSYFHPSWQIVRRGIQIAAKAVPEWSPKMLKVFYGMGLTVGVNALLTLRKYPEVVKGFFENLSLHDIEGAIFGGIALLINPLEILDSSMTFINSLSSLGVVPVVAVFGMLGLPVALTLLGYCTMKGIYDSARLGMEMGTLPQKIEQSQIDFLKDELASQLEATQAERDRIERSVCTTPEKIDRKIEVLQSRKIKQLTRKTDEKIVGLMQKLLADIRKNDANINDVNKELKSIHTLMNRKLKAGNVGTLGCIALGTVLAATYVFPVSSVLISSVIILKNAIALGKTIYMNNFYSRGI